MRYFVHSLSFFSQPKMGSLNYIRNGPRISFLKGHINFPQGTWVGASLHVWGKCMYFAKGTTAKAQGTTATGCCGLLWGLKNEAYWFIWFSRDRVTTTFHCILEGFFLKRKVVLNFWIYVTCCQNFALAFKFLIRRIGQETEHQSFTRFNHGSLINKRFVLKLCKDALGIFVPELEGHLSEEENLNFYREHFKGHQGNDHGKRRQLIVWVTSLKHRVRLYAWSNTNEYSCGLNSICF